MATYSIKSGETIFGIAKAHNTTVKEISKLNPNLNINQVKIGQKINLPDSSSNTDTFEKKTTSNVNPKTHAIEKGDTLEKIAKKYFIPIADLKNANKNLNPANLKIGANVTIPEKKSILQPVNEKDENFKNLVSKILKDEGGFKPAEKNGADVKTNKGITQEVYNRYLRDKAFDKSQSNPIMKDVKNITEKEVKEIYYNYYYKACGADKEKDKKTSYWMMDTAVNCGVQKAQTLRKTCGTNNEKWYNSRKQNYNSIVQHNSTKRKFLAGWLNRIDRIKNSTIS